MPRVQAYRQQSYLDEMQIDGWELNHPERLSGYAPEPLILPDSCVLLLVSPVLPQNAEAEYLSKVLASIKLSVEQAMHVYPRQLTSVDFSAHPPKWIWFAGDELSPAQAGLPQDSQVLSSPSLCAISGSPQHRRALWQQICSYESN